ncbi:phage portal protein [Allorhodopirellula solitaria]|uniref:Phage portal protein, lambda family n=1 Tax=Allorhodopirellula solitaria TaxID=2527987 RepID=A0A5C5YIZ1_9BACT|nr:phage portal protein [Allorhodopirellula solitaria]TWT74830.1 Phage portal protein, lambda family [Allorhodopirellula solitaria]
MLKRLSGFIEQLRGGSDRRPDASGRSPRQPFFSRLRAKYDAANTTLDNMKHWSRTDGLSSASANSPEVRRTLRNRSRYEVANNSYARGITLTLANDVVGTGPRLQMLTPDDAANRFVEAEFFAWAEAIGLAEKLRTMRLARVSDGKSFGLLTSNERVDARGKLDLRLIEADQVASPTLVNDTSRYIDGIRFDADGNPISYDVLRHHPGDDFFSYEEEYNTIPSAAVLHYFCCDRPGQIRGVPDITPALPLFAQLRRFTLAVLAAAETAADFAGILYTDAPANGEADSAEPFEPIELEKRMLLTMPGGWKMSQMKSEQPSTTYAEFKKEILNEIARCLNMPFNVAAGNSSGYNYASGRLDHQTYFKSIRVEQTQLARVVLDRILNAWLREAILIEGYLPNSLRTLDSTFEHQWFWDGHEHVDPAKEANAQKIRLASHTTTLAIEFARQGRDWETELKQRAKELALMRDLGLTIESDESDSPPETKVTEDNAEKSQQQTN